MPDTFTHPIVFVEGFLVATSAVFWGGFKRHLDRSKDANRRVILTSVGPVSSLHDRACELYYELKGGRVDYGETHAGNFGHERYGREYKIALYPPWSTEWPLHFLGHSMGGPTITKLIALIREGFFGEEAHPDMVLSVTSVSAPFRGTQVVYALGEQVDGAPAVRPFSVGSVLTRAVHTLAYLAPILPFLPFDLHADSRRLGCNQSSFSEFLRQMWRSNWAEGRDAAPYDCTFSAADERESRGEGLNNPGTWYQSHVSISRRDSSGKLERSSPDLSFIYSPFYFPARNASHFNFLTIRPSPSWLRPYIEPGHSKMWTDPLNIAECGQSTGSSQKYAKQDVDLRTVLGEEYWANDGVVPVFSQWHPSSCSSVHCIHSDAQDNEDVTSGRPQTPTPGIWHVRHQPGAVHHMALIPLWFGTQQQQKFWADLGLWLELVEKARGERFL
ncbi:alpha/beta-hydrolase [Ramaria rubella]|nr:alpha/beta-hydrolase [Ramaria rubella]